MSFIEIAEKRYSSRKYDFEREVEEEKIDHILSAARLAPSACNGQPYHITVLRGDSARAVADATTEMGMNRFTKDAPVMLVISEEPYVKTAAFGAKIKKNDYRSIDIGIVASYIALAAEDVGLGACILGWFSDERVREICGIKSTVRLVISLGYAKDAPIPKKRKDIERLVTKIYK